MCSVEEKASQEAAKAQRRAAKAKKGAGQKNTILDHFAAAKTVRPALRPAFHLFCTGCKLGLCDSFDFGCSRMYPRVQLS
jgi:hypothetical protein